MSDTTPIDCDYLVHVTYIAVVHVIDRVKRRHKHLNSQVRAKEKGEMEKEGNA